MDTSTKVLLGTGIIAGVVAGVYFMTRDRKEQYNVFGLPNDALEHFRAQSARHISESAYKRAMDAPFTPVMRGSIREW